MSCLLYGGYTVSHYPGGRIDKEPEYICIQDRMPLERLLRCGIEQLSLQAIQKFQQGLTSRDSNKIYLLEPTESDIAWALEDIRKDAWTMRTLLRREAKIVSQHGSRDELRSMSEEELFSRFRKLITRVPVEMGEPHIRWHHLLTEREGLPYEDRNRVLEQIARLQDAGTVELIKEEYCNSYLPAGGEEQWQLLQGDRRLVLDRSRCSVLEIQNFQSNNHRFDNQQQWQDWITENLGQERRVDLASASGHINLPELGGLGDLHQWEALIGGSDTPEQTPSLADLSDRQPPAAWMPGMNGVFIKPVPEERVADSPAELALSVQLYNLGNLINLGCPAQPNRLQRQTQAVRLFQPVNPFRPAPLPMSGQSLSEVRLTEK